MKNALDNELALLRAFFQQDPDIEIAILFGSMATGKFTSKSDVDLAIKKTKPLSDQQKKAFIEQIAQITGRAVDLIDLSVVGEPLLGQIIKHGKRLIGTDSRYAELALRHVYAQADFVPYIERTLKERRQQWLDN